VPLDQIIAEDRLTEIPGIGDAIADIVTKLYRTGTHRGLEAMRKEIPAGVLEMLAVPGLRPDKVLELYKELGITSLAGLEQAAREGRLKRVKGLGGALQAKILQNLAILRSGAGRRHMRRAALLLENAERSLREAHPELKRITFAGDLRRGCELVADLSLVAEAPALDGRPATLEPGGGLTVHLTDKRHYGMTLPARDRLGGRRNDSEGWGAGKARVQLFHTSADHAAPAQAQDTARARGVIY
jgi:DNA polymerase (family 10)